MIDKKTKEREEEEKRLALEEEAARKALPNIKKLIEAG